MGLNLIYTTMQVLCVATSMYICVCKCECVLSVRINVLANTKFHSYTLCDVNFKGRK